MTVAAGVGGTVMASALIGPSVVGTRHNAVTVASTMADQLAATGASHLSLEIAIGLVAVVAGFLILGFLQRFDGRSASRPAPG